MSLTKEDLKAISDLIDVKMDVQNKRFDAIDRRFDEQDRKIDSLKEEFKEMLIDNNLLIAEHVQRVVSESEQRLMTEIREIKSVTVVNCYEIAKLKTMVH